MPEWMFFMTCMNQYSINQTFFCLFVLVTCDLRVRECNETAICFTQIDGFFRRFDPQLMKIHKQIKSGKVGKVRMVKTISRDPPGMATKQYIETSGMQLQ